MTVRVVAFARIREILGEGSLLRAIDAGATIASVWLALAGEHPALAALRESTRFACNGAFAPETHVLGDGDEVALLPPFGGG